jgi:glutamyl-tRNA synthetase
MHVGNVRTALFNWLFARSKNGTFILRIEDTDLQRHVDDAVDLITEGLSWLGMDWDEGPEIGGDFGPYFQSQREHLYRSDATRLIEAGLAYPCYCELEGRESGPCPCSERDVGEIDLAGEGIAVRFRNPGGTTSFADIVQGELSFDNEQFGDFVILKSDGTPTYNYANVVDDHAMKVTHIVRGDDHLSNTPRQLMLYRSLGYCPPEFAHLPQILGPDGTRLSKRHGAASLTDYRDQGFLPQALMNYLALLGWSPEGEQELLFAEELISQFRLDRVRQSASQFNRQKLVHLNSLHMEQIPVAQRVQLATDILCREGIVGDPPDEDTRAYVSQIIGALGSRFKYGEQILDYGAHFFTDEITIDEELHSYLSSPPVRQALALTADRLLDLQDWTDSAIEEVVRSSADRCDLKAAPLIHGIRVALSGKTVGPSLFTLVRLVGQARSSRRIHRALELVPPEGDD